MEQIRRVRLGASAWKAMLERFAQSGVSVAEFCAREGVSTTRFSLAIGIGAQGGSASQAQVRGRVSARETGSCNV